jgi:hypothetical protein
MKTFGKGLNNMKNIPKKLLEFQNKVGAIKKDSTNPFFKSSYFDINALLKEVKPILTEVGLILLQPLTTFDGKPALITRILDSESEESFEEKFILPENPDAQKMGAIITYFRRYCVQSMLSLEAEDDDGNSASNGQNSAKSGSQKPQTSKSTSSVQNKSTEEQLKQFKENIIDLCNQLGCKDKTKEGYEKFVLEKTGFKNEPDKYGMIIKSLKLKVDHIIKEAEVEFYVDNNDNVKLVPAKT